MAVIEWLQFIIGAILLVCGLGIFTVEMIGVYRFHYVLNRMHAAAMGDTLGIGFCLVGLIVMNGLNFTSLKLFLVVAFLWFSSPTSSHLIARLEVTTDTEKEKHYREVTLSVLEQELQGGAGEPAGVTAGAADLSSAARMETRNGMEASGKEVKSDPVNARPAGIVEQEA